MCLRSRRRCSSTQPTRWAAPFRVGGARFMIETGHDLGKVPRHRDKEELWST